MKARCPTAAEWNEKHPIGTEVTFWPGAREGDGRISKTRSSAWDVCGQPVVLVKGYAGGIALTHVVPLQAVVDEALDEIFEKEA